MNEDKPSDVIKKITNDLFKEAGSPKDATIEQHNHAAIQAIIKYLDGEREGAGRTSNANDL